MPIYRFYPLGSSGMVSGPATDLECHDDMVAFTQANRLVEEGKPVQVWLGAKPIFDLDRQKANPT